MPSAIRLKVGVYSRVTNNHWQNYLHSYYRKAEDSLILNLYASNYLCGIVRIPFNSNNCGKFSCINPSHKYFQNCWFALNIDQPCSIKIEHTTTMPKNPSLYSFPIHLNNFQSLMSHTSKIRPILKMRQQFCCWPLNNQKRHSLRMQVRCQKNLRLFHFYPKWVCYLGPIVLIES